MAPLLLHKQLRKLLLQLPEGLQLSSRELDGCRVLLLLLLLLLSGGLLLLQLLQQLLLHRPWEV